MGLRKAAEKVEINYVHLNRIERGLPPSSETIAKLSRAYGLSDAETKELYALAKRVPDKLADELIKAYKNDPDRVEEFFRKHKKDENS